MRKAFLLKFRPPGNPAGPAVALLLGGLVAGCDQPQITTYRAPRPQSATGAKSTPAAAAAPLPQATWKLPAGWRELAPNQVAVANFEVSGSDGSAAQVSIAPLPLLAGREVEVVNMWRQQYGLPELPREDVAARLTAVEAAGGRGQLFEVAGQAAEAAPAQRIITVMTHRETRSWFFKISGSAPLVEAQKPVFLEFIKSVNFSAAPGRSTAGADSAAAAPAFKWPVPPGWQSLAPGQMQVARFAPPERKGAKAEVTVSVFGGETGGKLANINRWRGQIGLPAVTEAELAGLLQPLDPQDDRAILVDMTHNGRTLIGAVVPRRNGWFFYKLLGDEPAVRAEKDTFIAFVKAEP